MAYTNIDDPSAHFQTTLYTGTSSSQSITNNGNSDMQPDMWWQINRDLARGTYVADSSRGVSKYLYTFLDYAEATASNYVTSFDSDGFTLGNGDTAVNNNAEGFVTWQWKANGGTTSSNTDGSITSTVQVNQDAGFSIGTFTGNGTSGATVGHGLGVKPDMLILKSRNNPSGAAMYWIVGHVGLDGMAGLKNLFMNQNWAVNTESVIWANTAPTSSVFSVGTNAAVNYTNNDMLFYAFANKQGYSKFGKYVGNSSADGPFVYTGFKPAFLIVKKTTAAGADWRILDSTRNPFNLTDLLVNANNTNAEFDGSTHASNIGVDFLSNGFKVRTTYAHYNGANDFIYMAFAEHPFVTSTGIMGTAR